LKVVNIAPHIGGGVGVVLADYVRGSSKLGIKNSLFCLDWCIQTDKDLSTKIEVVEGAFWEARGVLFASLSDCDIVFVHYWNHPLLTVFLSEVDLRNYKVVFWCHISGLIEPHIIPNYLLKIADKIIFTSRISLQAPNFAALDFESKSFYSVVRSVRDLDIFFQVGSRRMISKTPTNLLYVGTVSKTKMHRDSAQMFAELSKHGYLIRVVGGPDHVELAKEVAHLGGEIEVFGLTKDVTEFYEMSDIFIYPLREDHYGTGEQVLVEALASGLPIVAFSNPSEYEILNQFKDMKLVDRPDEFVDSVYQLTESADLLFQISKNTFQIAQSLFRSGKMAEHLVDVFTSVKNSKMDSKNLCSHDELAFDLVDLYARASFFDESMHKNSQMPSRNKLKAIISAIETHADTDGGFTKWQSENKSSPNHYLRYFPDNKLMRLLKIQIDVIASKFRL
jgi:glycosyltransferase involved in cell wall biosynthesis